MNCFDAIVVGAGPGGAMTAITLAEGGHRVLLLEKQQLPRHKPCGGALSAKVGEFLDFPAASLSKSAVRRARLGILGGTPVKINYGTPFMHVVDRAEFDHHLVRLAAVKGVTVREGEAFQSLEESGGCVMVKTVMGKYKARFIVGADGAHSAVRARLGLAWKPLLGIALEGEYRVEGRINGLDADCCVFDLGHPESGYSWIFPRGPSLSVGLGTFRPALPGAKELLKLYLEAKGLDSLCPSTLRGHPIPCDGAVKKKLHTKIGVLVGDAAGLVDPLTGEGIYYALLSGKIAGEELAKALSSRTGDLSGYSRRVNSQITRKLKGGARIASLVYRYPEYIVKLFDAQPEMGRILLDTICGKASYNSLILQLLASVLLKEISRGFRDRFPQNPNGTLRQKY